MNKYEFDWTKSGRSDKFIYRVCRKEASGIFTELDFIDGIVSSSYSCDYSTELKQSGTVDAIGGTNLAGKYIRMYQVSEIGNDRVEFPAWTMRVDASSETVDDTESGNISYDLQSVLFAVKAKRTVFPKTIKGGRHLIPAVADIVAECGVAVEFDDIGVMISNDIVYPAGTSYLTIVNELLVLAGYKTLGVDEYGRGIIEIVDEENAEAVYDYSNALISSEKTITKSNTDIHNVAIVTYSVDDYTYTGIAKNVSSLSKYSIQNMGYEYAVSSSASAISSDDLTPLQIQAQLDRQAADILSEEQSVYDYLDFKAPYSPIKINDIVKIPIKGDIRRGIVEGISYEALPGVITSVKVRSRGEQ